MVIITEHKESLPPLNPAQITKLKYLTIVTLGTERHVRPSPQYSFVSTKIALQILPYSLLLQELQVASIRELEDLIIDAIYLDILRGKLDQKEQQLEIEYTMGRDLEPGKLEKLLEALQNWSVPSHHLSLSSASFICDSGQRRRRPCCQSSTRNS